MMVRAADLLSEARRVPGIAGQSTVTADWDPVAARIRDEATDDWNDKVAVERFEGKGGRFIRGEGRLTGPGHVEVGNTVIRARKAIVLATGTAAQIPPIPGLTATPFWTNRAAIEAPTLPASIIVLGGGAIGVELAQVLARFGVAVTVIEALERLLPQEEPEVGRLIADVLLREGIQLVAGVSATKVDHDAGQFTVTIGDGQQLSAERLLVATGRRAELGSLGLTSIGVDDTARWVPVDDHLRVVPGVWAVGDLTGKGGCSPTSRCTRPTSRWQTFWAKTTLPPTIALCRGLPSATPRRAA